MNTHTLTQCSGRFLSGGSEEVTDETQLPALSLHPIGCTGASGLLRVKQLSLCSPDCLPLSGSPGPCRRLFKVTFHDISAAHSGEYNGNEWEGSIFIFIFIF